jgi:hypothetical protein
LHQAAISQRRSFHSAGIFAGFPHSIIIQLTTCPKKPFLPNVLFSSDFTPSNFSKRRCKATSYLCDRVTHHCENARSSRIFVFPFRTVLHGIRTCDCMQQCQLCAQRRISVAAAGRRTKTAATNDEPYACCGFCRIECDCRDQEIKSHRQRFCEELIEPCGICDGRHRARCLDDPSCIKCTLSVILDRPHEF